MKRALIAALIALATAGCGAPNAVAATGVVEAVTASGGVCGNLDKDGERHCEMNGFGFKVVPGEAWTQSQSTRNMACKMGYIKADHNALTDGHWMINASSNDDYPPIQDALSRQGVQSNITAYCP